MSAYTTLKQELSANPRRWLVTGGAGFIGSHLIHTLLSLGQEVRCLDNFVTGFRENLDAVTAQAGDTTATRLEIREGNVEDAATCQSACEGVDYVLHQAALGSVPWSIHDPLRSHDYNVTGSINIFTAARDAGVKRVVYASSSAVYGDEPGVPAVEEKTGNLLSPYAATKAICEVYAQVFQRCYGQEIVGLRYFNVFGPRQDPSGPYAAVIPLWVDAMLSGKPVHINGDGSTTRDFCYVANVVQANLLAATIPGLDPTIQAFNIAVGESTTLNELFHHLRDLLTERDPRLDIPDPIYRDFRAGDVKHSMASISRAEHHLGFAPEYRIGEGLKEAIGWYHQQAQAASREA